MSLKVMAVQAILILGPQVHGSAIAPTLPPPPHGVNLQNLASRGAGTVVQNSRLLRLPPELRNQIYQLVLLDAIQDFRFTFHHYPSPPSLLETCHQIRLEARCIYFRRAQFEFVVHWRGLRALLRYLGGLDLQAQQQLVRNKNFSVHIIYDSYHPRYNEVKKWLGKFSYAYRNSGPYLTAENCTNERAPVNKMRSQAARTPLRAARIAAEAKAIAEQGVDAVKCAKEAAKAVNHQDMGRALLHKELGIAFDQIMACLPPPPASKDDGV